jgi:hypothetical protein
MLKHKKLRYLLTFIDTFTGWIKDIPTATEGATIVADTLIIPRFGLPRSLQSDNGPAFISKVTQLVCKHLAITWRLHTPYHPQSSGKVERANGLTKQQLTKLSLELRLSWVDLLPLALTCLLVAPRQPTGLSPFELLYGCPFLLSHTFPSSTPPLIGYPPYLTLLLSLLRAHADHYLPQSDTVPPDYGPLSPGNSILLKQLHPKPLQPRWTGPYTVILTTPAVVKLLGHPTWYHFTQHAYQDLASYTNGAHLPLDLPGGGHS